MEKDDTDYRTHRLPNGQTVGDVIRRERTGLLSNWRASLDNTYPSEIGPISGYSLLGDFYGRVRPHGENDFKNRFPGRTPKEADLHGKLGNFAYYAIGDGIVPRGLLDLGAAGYAMWNWIRGEKKSSGISSALIDNSAYSVRDKALSLPDDP